MRDEMVFTVSGATATAAEPIGLAAAGFKERQHLQEWVIAHPQVLGPDVKIVAFEFGRWAARSGALERDRLDVLALDSAGQLIVVELKRDKAPDTAEMQALKYAALVSRFTRDHLVKVHAEYLTRRRGEMVDPETAEAELEEWLEEGAEIIEESLRLPRLVLMATGFPKTVTATVVFLHQQLGLDVRLLAFHAYRTTNEVLLTVSQHYPPPGVEEFVLSPEVNEARQQRTEKQTRQREVTAVARLIEAGALAPGTTLEFRAPSAELQTIIEPWLGEQPSRRTATWQDDSAAPLQWAFDGSTYTPTGLARIILEEAAGKTSPVQGPLYWITAEGHTFVDLARELPAGVEVPIEEHLDKLSSTLKPVYEALDSAFHELGPDVTRRSRAGCLKYFAQRKLCDLLIHSDHLSVYVHGLDFGQVNSGLVVGGTNRYIHAQVRTSDEIGKLIDLLRPVYEKQAT
ncbi:MAG: DUF5655 domain-containing protein [Actinomycetota bacterium]|nr:DUF5655 domain-containing protein [Actinomycetota bacterium]